MVLVMSVSDGERSQTGKAGMGMSCCDRQAAPGVLGLLPNPLDVAGMGSHTGTPWCGGCGPEQGWAQG